MSAKPTSRITFYSYKGGVGRSLSLLNVAVALRDRGFRVGLVDMDVEASGLHEILRLPVQPGKDLLTLLGSNPGRTFLQEVVLPVTRADDPTGGALFLLPCLTDVDALNRIGWTPRTYRTLDEITTEFERLHQLDFVLIDARTGVSTFGSFALFECELVVLVGRPDRQNRAGLAGIVAGCRAQGKQSILVMSGVPKGGDAKARLKEVARAVEAPIDFVLPYDPVLVFDEDPYLARDDASALGKAFKALANRIVETRLASSGDAR